MSLLGGHRVYFGYKKETIQVQQNNQELQVTRPVTSCTIEDLDKNVIAKHTVKLHHKDVPNRLIAREVAFKNAVNTIKDRALRKAIHSDFRTNLKWVHDKD